MEYKNTKRIEEAATTALKNALLKCPMIEAHISENDRTPAWDGQIFVYKSEDTRKENIDGIVPVQIKGTGKKFKNKMVSYSCKANDLCAYYRDGGCIFFYISVNPDTSENEIYYKCLLTYDLKIIINQIGNNQSYTIHLDKFPQNDKDEMTNILIQFVSNANKQKSFIGKDILSLEELKKRGVTIESVSFTAIGIGPNAKNPADYISTHDIYLYARIKGVDIDIPVDKVEKPIINVKIHKPVSIGNKKYYDSYNVIHSDGKASFKIGKNISFVENEKTEKSVRTIISISGKHGTLKEYLKDLHFFFDLHHNKKFSIANTEISLNNEKKGDIDKLKSIIRFYEDVQKMLDILGVTEDLNLELVDENDENNILNFVDEVIYKTGIFFNNIDTNFHYGSFAIANLSISIWANKLENGSYRLHSFNDAPNLLVYNEQKEDNTISVSKFLLYKKENFNYTSNINYDLIYNDLKSMEFSDFVVEQVVLLVLEMLKGYDMQKDKESKLLELAANTCNLISEKNSEYDQNILLLNKLQIAKRQRKLTIQEKRELMRITECDNINNQCGAFILLDEFDEAKKCFDKMDSDQQKTFHEYPICSFYDFTTDNT